MAIGLLLFAFGCAPPAVTHAPAETPSPASGAGPGLDAPEGPPAVSHPPTADTYAPIESDAEWAARYGHRPAESRERGKASYYADSLAGNRTASGERYDPKALTAAHRTLPFGTIVRVIREDTGKVVYARINDRGPFIRGRIVDLSRAAARLLEMIRSGVVAVRLEVVELGAERETKNPKRIRARPRRR